MRELGALLLFAGLFLLLNCWSVKRQDVFLLQLLLIPLLIKYGLELMR